MITLRGGPILTDSGGSKVHNPATHTAPAVLLLMSVAACGPKTTPTPATEEAPAEAEAVAVAVADTVTAVTPAALEVPAGSPATITQLHMSEHFVQAEAARKALLDGRVDEARASMKWMGAHRPDPRVPSEWGGWFELMQASALQGAQATDPVDVASSMAEVGNSCGGCHESIGRTARIPEPSKPDVASGVAGHMATHKWASDVMWLALIEPSAELWTIAVEELGQEKLGPDDFPEGMKTSASIDQWATQVHTAASGAKGDDNPDTRADLYGEMIGGCIGCHLEVRGPAE